MLKNLKSLNSGCFLYENYEPNWWSVLDLSFAESLETKSIHDCIEKYGVGYCDGSQVLIRPRTNAYAVMFEKDGDRFWFHIDDWQFDDNENLS